MSAETEDCADKSLGAGGSMNASGRFFAVQARVAPNAEPRMVGDLMLTHQWKRVEFERGAVGVPHGRPWQWGAEELRLLSWPAAQALRWWWLAQYDAATFGAHEIETRLVEHAVNWSVQSTTIAAHDPTNGDNTCLPLKDQTHG